jgi:hypothetical protein
MVTYATHQGDVDAKMIELSIGILRAAPTQETLPLRDWAIDVIEKRSKFAFNAAQKTALRNKQLPYVSAAEIGAAVAKTLQTIPQP